MGFDWGKGKQKLLSISLFLAFKQTNDNNNNNKNIYLPPKNTSTVMLGTGDYVHSNSGNTY